VTADEWLRRPGTVGLPMAGVTLRMLDEDGNELPPGETGLVYLSQAFWQFDYHHDPAKTAASRRDGLFILGDMGYVDEDGYLFLCDRQAEVVISGGVNIYPAEVEARLLTHPAVGDTAVIGVPDDEWGEAVRAIVEPAGASRRATSSQTRSSSGAGRASRASRARVRRSQSNRAPRRARRRGGRRRRPARRSP
jgi:long-chain acyl-CoA synthetase